MTISPDPLRHNPVRDRLRAVTDDIHQALHRLEPFAAIAAGTLGRERYGTVLAFLYRYHRGMQPACERGARALGLPELGQAHQARIAALQQDLAALGLAAAAPEPAELDAETDGAFAAGCLYTVQGSTLGGKLIARQLDYLLPDDAGRHFFRGTPADGRHWQALCAGLEGLGPSAALEDGALFAFHRFGALAA